MNPNRLELPLFILKPSIFFLIARLLVTEFLFAFLYLLVRIPKTLLLGFELSPETLAQVQQFGILYYMVIAVIQILVILYIVLEYENSTYEIRPQLIARVSGIFNKQTETYSLRNVESIKVTQGVVGRICNFGDVILHNTSLQQDFYLSGISNPQSYSNIIEDVVSQITQLRMAPTGSGSK